MNSEYDKLLAELGTCTDKAIELADRLLQVKLGLIETAVPGEYIDDLGNKFVKTLHGFFKLGNAD